MAICDPISEVMPPSDSPWTSCYHQAYLNYVSALASCNGNPECCATILSAYWLALHHCTMA